MNVLSFDKDYKELDDGYEKEFRNCYYYVVDGKRLDWGTSYHPLSYYEILETPEDYLDESKLIVILNTCSCGEWFCDSYVAQISLDESYVYWKVYNINQEEIINEYSFEKQAYEKTMFDFKQLAKQEYIKNCKKGAYIFYWKNGETCPFSFSSNKDIIDYWNEKNTPDNPLKYYENAATGEKFSVIENKIVNL